MVPLRARGITLGLAILGRHRTPEPFDDDDLLLAKELAARAAVCVDNARRYTRERDTALALQRSLLPQHAPRQTAVEVASRYRPASSRVGIGGDWFNVIPLSHRHDVITGSCDNSSAEPLPVEQLRRSLTHARLGFQAGHFVQLSGAIPKLLVDTTRAAQRHAGDDRLVSYELLSLSLELTEAAAIKWGSTDLAVIAGHRAVAAAERSENPVIKASAARHLGDAMTTNGQAAEAAEFVLAAAQRLQPELLRSGPDGYSVLGMLYLKAAITAAAAAEAEDRNPGRYSRRVPDFLGQAEEQTERLGGDDNRLWTSFGPTNVALYTVAAHVQLSEGADAVAVASGIPAESFGNLPKERRAHLLTDRAHGELQAGFREQAVATLLEAEELAPEEVQCRPRTRALVENLQLLVAGSAEGRLRALADRCGLPG